MITIISIIASDIFNFYRHILSINHNIFRYLYSTNHDPLTVIISIFFAKWLILAAVLKWSYWLWHAKQNLHIKYLCIKFSLSIGISLCTCFLINSLIPFDRPFVSEKLPSLINHVSDSSFPSRHASVIFTFAISHLLWVRSLESILWILIAFAIAWSRIYLGLHWPLDMLGALLLAFVSCTIVQVVFSVIKNKNHRRI